MNKPIMKKGYGIFGKAYELMFRNDLHDKRSIDHRLLKSMVLIDKDSIATIYKRPHPISNDIEKHELYSFAQKLKDESDLESIYKTVDFVNEVVKNYHIPFEDMLFGGTEKEIMKRGSDWCTDISRLGAALLQCLGMPSRIAILVNQHKAYHGHQVVEVYMDGTYMMCDFLYGVIGKLDHYYSVYDLLKKPNLIQKIYQSKIEDTIQLDYISGLFDLAAISEYDITKKHNYYITKPNEYYLKMMKLIQNGTWQMNENKQE